MLFARCTALARAFSLEVTHNVGVLDGDCGHFRRHLALLRCLVTFLEHRFWECWGVLADRGAHEVGSIHLINLCVDRLDRHAAICRAAIAFGGHSEALVVRTRQGNAVVKSVFRTEQVQVLDELLVINLLSRPKRSFFRCLAVILLQLLSLSLLDFLKSGHGPLLHLTPHCFWVPLSNLRRPVQPGNFVPNLIRVIHTLKTHISWVPDPTPGRTGILTPWVPVSGLFHKMLNFAFLRLCQRLGVHLGHHVALRAHSQLWVHCCLANAVHGGAGVQRPSPGVSDWWRFEMHWGTEAWYCCAGGDLSSWNDLVRGTLLATLYF